MQMIKAVIFDMDGVIIDSEPLHRYAYNEMFKEVKYPEPIVSYEEQREKALQMYKKVV